MNPAQPLSPKRLALTRKARRRTSDGHLTEPQPLSDFRDISAWVLIADPGAGKTDAFQTLSTESAAHYIKARDFVELESAAERSSVLFIDGLDEISGDSRAGHTAIGRVRSKLQKLGTPKFRISCREADWRGNTDSEALRHLVGDENFIELHLEPLEHEQVIALIRFWQGSTAAQAERLAQETRKRGLETLLGNPQTLRMLVKAVGQSNTWPSSKIETYKMACSQLVRENNEEHLAAQRDSPISDGELIEAAGCLSAVLLLSGSSAIINNRSPDPCPGTLALNDISANSEFPRSSVLRAALETLLFNSNGSGDFLPIHRTVAEYLGATFLTSRIQAGLPTRRVLALMLGEDGGVVPELRGLYAWLAALAPQSVRWQLIERDPLGIILNGDVQGFSRSEKLRLLEALKEEAGRYTYFRRQHWASHPFGALATPDMEGDFQSWLRSADRSPAHMATLDCILDALAHGAPMYALAPELEQVVRDNSYWPILRRTALDILHDYAQASGDWSLLTGIFSDLTGNLIEDLEDELLGKLLQALYPRHVSPQQLWSYLRAPKNQGLLGSYWKFWQDLPEHRAAESDLPALLDSLVASGFQLDGKFDHMRSTDMVGALLTRGVRSHGTSVEIPRLYQWLSLGLGAHEYNYLGTEHKKALAQWLVEHPDIYKALFEHGLGDASSHASGTYRLWRVHNHLYDAATPHDAHSWYLSLARTIADDSLRWELVMAAFRSIADSAGPDSAIAMLEHWKEESPADTNCVDSTLCSPYPPPQVVRERMDHKSEVERQTAEERRQWVAFVRKTMPSVVTGPAHLGLLAEIANAYLNFFPRFPGETARARLLALLNDDAESVRLGLEGLRNSLFRDDIPSAEAIIDLYLKGQRYNLATPCLAAMELRYTEEPLSALTLPPSILESVIAFQFVTHISETPAWFKQAFFAAPESLTKVIQYWIGKQITANKEHIDGLYQLAYDADYAEIAKRLAPGIISRFPRKTGKKRLLALQQLIAALLNNLDRPMQLHIIGERLDDPGIDTTQRTYWLMAGLLIDPDRYLATAKDYVGARQNRAMHAFALVHALHDREKSPREMTVAVQEFLICLLAPWSNPSRPAGVHWVTPEMEMSRYVQMLISSLAANPDDEAALALSRLQQRQGMHGWSDLFSSAIYDQRVNRRKARFKPADVTQVCETLANRQPANAADLWALTVDHLAQLIHDIRNGSTNDYRQYWADAAPRSENDCRDTLLSDLKFLLTPVQVTAEREGNYADDKRADIKVIFAPHHIPIEVKRETHADLWKAVPEQLIGKYGRELASDGYGIYLVFWFGGVNMPAPADGGARPKTPQELQQRLLATVPHELQHKIAVLVADCSR